MGVLYGRTGLAGFGRPGHHGGMSVFARGSQLWPVVGIAALFGAAFAPQSFGYGATDWERVYVTAAERFERGEDIYRDSFVYPPVAAVLAVPSAHLGGFGVRVNVWLMNVAGATALVGCGWRLTGGRLSLRPPPGELLIAAVGLPAFLGAAFEVMVNRQTDLLVGGLAVGGCLLVARGRDWPGGAAVGLAAALKCTPLLFAAYFVWVGRGRAGAAVLLVAVAANLLPDLLVPPPEGHPRLGVWAERYLLMMGKAEYQPGVWAAAEWSNHSLAGVIRRLSMFRLEPTAGGFAPTPAADPPTPAELKVAVYAAALAVLAAGAVVVRRRFAAVEPFGIGMGFCLMLLVSPMSSKPHFVVLAVPAWAVARAGVEGGRWGPLAVAALAGACELTAAKDLVGGRVNAVAMWYGALPAGVLLLLAGCARARWAAVTPPSPPPSSCRPAAAAAPRRAPPPP
jgi:hypothetical protein